MIKQRKTFIYYPCLLILLLAVAVSCSKNNTPVTDFQYGSLSDNEGNVYKTITIGSQTWMAENLRSIKLNDGTAIPNVTNNNTWSTLTTPAYCYYGNDSVGYKGTYGAFYNWYTVQTNKLCPVGWHVPSDQEWTTLSTSLGVDSLAGGKLKAVGAIFWYSPNSYATNVTGFGGLGCGYRFYNGSYHNSGISGNWWSSTAYTGSLAWYRYLTYDNGKVGKNFVDKLYGFSVRCLKN